MTGRKRVVVIEGEDAAPEAVRPTVGLVEALGVPIDWLRPDVEDHAATRAAIDASDTTLFGATSGRSAAALFHLRWGKSTYANVRPARWWPGYRSPLAHPAGIGHRDGVARGRPPAHSRRRVHHATHSRDALGH